MRFERSLRLWFVRPSFACDPLRRLSSRRPLGAMNMYYLSMALIECLDKIHGDGMQASTATCDLESTPLLVMLAGCITSCALLAYKAAHVEVIRLKWEEQTMLEAERAELIASIDETMSDEIADHVEALMPVPPRASKAGGGGATVLPLQPIAPVEPASTPLC
jgi:hypothetical protein